MREKITKRNQQTGFTIIEVVLVLAIAGLIFLIVFLALPQLQRSRRDTQRKSDLGLIMGKLDTYASNNGGSYPESLTDADFLELMDENMKDPSSGTAYSETFEDGIGQDWSGVMPSTLPGEGVAYANDGGEGSSTEPGTIAYSRGAQCNGDTAEEISGDGRIATMIKLESGRYCLDNS